MTALARRGVQAFRGKAGQACAAKEHFALSQQRACPLASGDLPPPPPATPDCPALAPRTGWDRGVEGMRVGDKRRLTIPPQMAYGSSGVKGAIPPNGEPC